MYNNIGLLSSVFVPDLLSSVFVLEVFVLDTPTCTGGKGESANNRRHQFPDDGGTGAEVVLSQNLFLIGIASIWPILVSCLQHM